MSKVQIEKCTIPSGSIVQWGSMGLNSDGTAEEFHYGEPDSAGGISVSPCIVISENSKQIKYVDFELVALNRVGDIIPDDTSGKYSFTVQEIGPITPDENGSARVGFQNIKECQFYNNTVASVSISSIKITFMDGSVEEFKGKDCELIESKSGCYVATCVYGSYDCPQVWTLRRFRDYELAKTWYGRAFIHTYYAISPTLVKWFGKTKWFKNMWKPKLDKMVKELQEKGVESSPYEDKIWR